MDFSGFPNAGTGPIYYPCAMMKWSLLLLAWLPWVAGANTNWPWPDQNGGTPSAEPTTPYWGAYRYRPLPQRPGLPPNSSGNPAPSQPPAITTYGYGRRGPGGYSYSYRIQRHSSTTYPAAGAPQAPRVEASLSERRPMVQQNLIYRLRIFSSGNLKEATPELPQSPALVFRQLGKPSSHTDATGALVTEYHYLLIPLEAGTFTLPPPKVKGRYNSGQAFEVAAEQPLQLYVQPARPGVVPWLPLYDLQLEAHLPRQGTAKAGEPLTLEIVTSAIGALGSQLPSVADQLVSDDFYIYPGEVTEEGRISSDGLDLLGRRVERFTLVPRYGGRLTLPGMALDWWNLRTGQAAKATLPMRQLQVSGPVGDSPQAQAGRRPQAGHLWYWLPLGLVALLLLAYWLKAVFGTGHPTLGGWARAGLAAPLARWKTPLQRLLLRYSPRRYLHLARTWIGRHLPVSWKLWYCLRALEREKEAAAWAHALQILAAKHLGARPNASLEELARIITRCHPAADAEQVARLLERLEQANYGNEPLTDFEAWKAAFKEQIRPRLIAMRLRRCGPTRRGAALPDLNPSPR